MCATTFTAVKEYGQELGRITKDGLKRQQAGGWSWAWWRWVWGLTLSGSEASQIGAPHYWYIYDTEMLPMALWCSKLFLAGL